MLLIRWAQKKTGRLRAVGSPVNLYVGGGYASMSLADRNWVLDARLITSRRQRDAGLSLSGSRRVFARRGFRFRPIPPAGIKVPV